MSPNETIGTQLSEALGIVAEELDASREELRVSLETRDARTEILLGQIKQLLVDQAAALAEFRVEVLTRLKDVETDVSNVKKKSANGNGLHAV
jgi:hypothetical protein